jgi:hypothetical protein
MKLNSQLFWYWRADWKKEKLIKKQKKPNQPGLIYQTIKSSHEIKIISYKANQNKL